MTFDRRNVPQWLVEQLDRIESKVDSHGRRLSRIEGGLVLGGFIMSIAALIGAAIIGKL